MRGKKLLKIFFLLIACAIFAFLGLVGMVWWKEKHPPELDHYDAIIVLGCQVKADGTPSLQLQYRLDGAYEAWLSHPCQIVVTGGKGQDEPEAEAIVMKNILMQKGVPEDQILCDTESTNTRENLQASRALLGQGDQKVLIVTSDYHLPRAIALAEDEGFVASGSGTTTLGGIHWIKNHSREALSWVKYWAEKYFGWYF